MEGHFKKGATYRIGTGLYVCTHANEEHAILLPFEGGYIYDQQTREAAVGTVNLDWLNINPIAGFMMPSEWLKKYAGDAEE